MKMNGVILWSKGVGVLIASVHAFSIDAEPEHLHTARLHFIGVDTNNMKTPPPMLIKATLAQVEDMASIPSYEQFVDFIKALG
jgi:hypothetical protein